MTRSTLTDHTSGTPVVRPYRQARRSEAWRPGRTFADLTFRERLCALAVLGLTGYVVAMVAWAVLVIVLIAFGQPQ